MTHAETIGREFSEMCLAVQMRKSHVDPLKEKEFVINRCSPVLNQNLTIADYVKTAMIHL